VSDGLRARDDDLHGVGGPVAIVPGGGVVSGAAGGVARFAWVSGGGGVGGGVRFALVSGGGGVGGAVRFSLVSGGGVGGAVRFALVSGVVRVPG
jgi:hypothetical protein